MLKIRVRGTVDELLQVIDDFKNDENTLSISMIYMNTRKCTSSKFGRVYIDYEY